MDKMLLKVLSIFIALFAISYIVVLNIHVPCEGVALTILNYWCSFREGCQEPRIVNTELLALEQAIALAALLGVAVTIIVAPKYKHFMAVFGLALILLAGATPPQFLLENVEWGLIVFLIGGMTLAFILRRMGVFKYLAIKLIELCRGSATLFVIYLGLLSWFLAMVMDEATSIIYVTMLIMGIYRLIKHDVKPLIVFSVIATNTGSLALPVGNPIGIYMAFKVGFTVTDFTLRALPLSILSLVVALAIFIFLKRNYIDSLNKALRERSLSKTVVIYYSDRPAHVIKLAKTGLLVLVMFLGAILLNDHIAKFISVVGKTHVDPHHLLVFIPYLFIVVLVPLYRVVDLEEALERGVEWPVLVFFISLFMIDLSIIWTGVAPKLAFLLVRFSEVMGFQPELFYEYMLGLSAGLGSVIDNLSAVIAFTNIAKMLIPAGYSQELYWALLYGGVLGGSYTPVGSTANIVAISMIERKTRISWREWCSIAFTITTVQIALALLWLKLL